MEKAAHPRVDFLASTLVTGGAERIVEALVHGLPGRGIGTRILCLYGPGEIGKAAAAAGAAVCSNFARFRRDPLAIGRLAAAMRKFRPAVLVSLDHRDAMLAGPAAARLSGVRRLALMVHSTGLWGREGSFSRAQRLALAGYDRVVALAPSHAAYLVERERVDAGKVAIIANGVDTERFRPESSAEHRERVRRSLGLPLESFVASIIAALRPEKNHELFLRAAARARDAIPAARFLIVGEGKEEEKLRALARSLSLEGSILFPGRRDDIPEILAASDVLVLPSHPVVETFPLVVLEAMAAGVPVIAADVGSVREMMIDGEEGCIIPSGDEEALVAKMLQLAADPARRAELAARARERVSKEFTIDLMIDKYADMIKSLIR